MKVWDIDQVSGKTPISTLECLVGRPKLYKILRRFYHMNDVKK